MEPKYKCNSPIRPSKWIWIKSKWNMWQYSSNKSVRYQFHKNLSKDSKNVHRSSIRPLHKVDPKINQVKEIYIW